MSPRGRTRSVVGPGTAVRALFATTAFMAAALVFLVQPMAAKQLLPAFGGAQNVWNTAVVFFQVVLLGGYALSHVSIRAFVHPRARVRLACPCPAVHCTTSG